MSSHYNGMLMLYYCSSEIMSLSNSMLQHIICILVKKSVYITVYYVYSGNGMFHSRRHGD